MRKNIFIEYFRHKNSLLTDIGFEVKFLLKFYFKMCFSAVENLTLSEYKECRKKEKDYRSRGGDPWS